MGKTIDFMSLVYPEPNTGCWLWAGGLTRGYGQLNPKAHNGLGYAHRYSYFIHKGDFDREKLLCHTCDVPSCVNPDHLYVGTHQDNIRDLLKRGNPKYALGKDVPCSKLTPEKVVEIRKLSKSGLSTRKIATIYNVSHTTIGHVLRRINWRHVN